MSRAQKLALPLRLSPSPFSTSPGIPQCHRHFSILPDKKNLPKSRERVLVVGSGWAGYALGRALSRDRHERVLVSPRSHFVFTPLLASTTVGTLEFRAVLEPVRRLGLDTYHQGFADAIDFDKRIVRVRPCVGDDDPSSASLIPSFPPSSAVSSPGSQDFPITYDRLVLAVGAHPQTFNIPGVHPHAHLLRTATDARLIRLRLLSLFEYAARPDVPGELRRQLLHFAIVGGGPTGVEFAAELHDLVREDLPKLYPDLVPIVSITVYDVAPTVLPMFEHELAGYATELFQRQGIRVRTEALIQEVTRAGPGHPPQEQDAGLLRLRIKNNGSRSGTKREENEEDRKEEDNVPAGIVVWSTGLAPNPLLSRLHGVRHDAKTGGLVTDEHLRVQGTDGRPIPRVYAIGDCAVVEGRNYPATAQVASQQAAYLGKKLNLLAKPGGVGREQQEQEHELQPFKFRNWGTMAYLGNWRAIHQSSADELKGRAAWILWRTAYLTYSMSVRNKIMVPVYWAMTWIFGRDISRF